MTPGTTYYFRAVAASAGGIASGTILSFTMTAAVPVATTQAATAVTSTTATLNASVNPENSATTATFVYGTDPMLMTGTTTTSARTLAAGPSPWPWARTVSGLTPNTTYYFEVVATRRGAPSPRRPAGSPR